MYRTINTQTPKTRSAEGSFNTISRRSWLAISALPPIIMVVTLLAVLISLAQNGLFIEMALPVFFLDSLLPAAVPASSNLEPVRFGPKRNIALIWLFNLVLPRLGNVYAESRNRTGYILLFAFIPIILSVLFIVSKLNPDAPRVLGAIWITAGFILSISASLDQMLIRRKKAGSIKKQAHKIAKLSNKKGKANCLKERMLPYLQLRASARLERKVMNLEKDTINAKPRIVRKTRPSTETERQASESLMGMLVRKQLESLAAEPEHMNDYNPLAEASKAALDGDFENEGIAPYVLPKLQLRATAAFERKEKTAFIAMQKQIAPPGYSI